MAHRGLFIARHLGESTVLAFGLEERVVTEAIGAANGLCDAAYTTALEEVGRLAIPECGDGHEVGATVRAPCHQAQDAVQSNRFEHVGGVHAREGGQGFDEQTAILDQNELIRAPGRGEGGDGLVDLRRRNFTQGFGLRLDEFGTDAIDGERGHLDAKRAEQCRGFGELARIPGEEPESSHVVPVAPPLENPSKAA